LRINEEGKLVTGNQAVEENKEPLQLTETTLPNYDEQGNEAGTKPAHQFEYNLPNIGQAKGMIVGNKASILEIFADKDENGDVKKGGGLYTKVVESLRNKGIKQIVVGVQSPASTAALQKLVKQGTLRIAPGSIQNGETDISGNPTRFNIEHDLVTEFDKTGALLGANEDSKAGVRAATSEQLADFLRGKVKSRGEIVDFQDSWNLKHPERPIKDSEALGAWNLIRPAKVDKGETITQPINEALKAQIKTFYRGVEKGARKGQKLVNENLIPKLQEALKEAKLTSRQVYSILNRVKTANLFTPGSQSKLGAFIDKVVTDAKYAEKLGEAKRLQKRLKKFGRQKNENTPIIYKVLARSFSRIDPNQTQDIDEYLDKANSVIDTFKPVKSDNYKAVNKSDTEDYIDKVLNSQDEEQEKNLTPNGEPDVEEYKAIAENSLDRLKEKDLSSFDSREKQIVETIKKIDLGKLDVDQLKKVIKIVDNIVENEDLSGEAFVENIAAVQKFNDEFADLVKDHKISELGVWARTMYNLSNMAKRMYQSEKIETFFRKFVHGPILQAGSQVEKALVDTSVKFETELKRLNKKYKTELREINHRADQMVFSLLYQMDNEADMTKMHRNIRETINRHQQVGNEEETTAWTNAYEKFKDVKTPEAARSIIEKSNPAVFEMWQMFGNDDTSKNGIFSDELASEQAKVAKELYNREYVPTTRYTPIVQHDVNSLYRIAESIKDGGQQNSSKKPFNPKQARSAKRRTLNLATNKVYTLDTLYGLDQLVR
jgi:hypothetical protein